MASSTSAGKGGRRQDPTLVLQDVIKYILRAVPQPEAVLDGNGNATRAGFCVGHNPQARQVLVEALGYEGSERAMIDRYRTAIGRALNSVLGVDPESHLTIVPVDGGKGAVLQVNRLNNEQIERLLARYSA